MPSIWLWGGFKMALTGLGGGASRRGGVVSGFPASSPVLRLRVGEADEGKDFFLGSHLPYLAASGKSSPIWVPLPAALLRGHTDSSVAIRRSGPDRKSTRL